MSKKELYDVLSLLLTLGTFDENDKYYNEIILDEKVNDCLSKAYFSMLCKDKEESDKYYNEFEKLYIELNEEQREIAKVEIAKILEIEYKPKTKIKKKER